MLLGVNVGELYGSVEPVSLSSCILSCISPCLPATAYKRVSGCMSRGSHRSGEHFLGDQMCYRVTRLLWIVA